MSVYAWDHGRKTIVKITKRGKRWCVYLLEKVIMPHPGTAANPLEYLLQRTKKTQFIFNPSPHESWSYKPFEDKDVLSSPEPLLELLRTWQPHIIRH